MPKAMDKISAPQSRRNFLTNVILPSCAALPVAAAGIATAAQATEADDPALSLINRYHEHTKKISKLPRGEEFDDEHPLMPEFLALSDAVEECQPTTAAGAAALIDYIIELDGGPEFCATSTSSKPSVTSCSSRQGRKPWTINRRDRASEISWPISSGIWRMTSSVRVS